jgi:hypothetical protein
MSRRLLACLFVLLPAAASGLTVSGTVVDGANNPVADATVRVQARPESTLSGPDGAFTLTTPDPFDPNLLPVVTAGREGYVIGSAFVFSDGQADLEIVLSPLPPDDPNFVFSRGTPEFCRLCHSAGKDVTIYEEFRSSRHFNAGRNTWVAALLQDYRTRFPDKSGLCADCHIPGAFVGTKQPGAEDLTDPDTVDFLALDPNSSSSPRRNGVQCLTCHRVNSVSQDLKAINLAGGATMSLASNPTHVYGPWDDVTQMEASPLRVFRESLYCAPCHEYDRPAEGARPPVPGQATYSEWLRWQARLPDSSPLKGSGTCQHCHMPVESVTEPGLACGTTFIERDPAFQPVRAHTFAGTVLGPGVPLPDGSYSMLDGAGTLDLQAVQTAAEELEVSVQLTNAAAGHKLPTGIDIRNLLVLVEAWDTAGRPLEPVPERSSLLPYWAGQGSGPEHDAGKPGKGYAKILANSRIQFDDPARQRVEFVEAECEVLDNRIEGALSDTFSVVYRLPAARGTGPVKVLARAVYRRAWADFTERFGLPPTDALGNPLAQHEIDRARLEFQPAASFTPPGGTVDLDFEADADGVPFTGGPAVVDQAYAAHGLSLSSDNPDGHAYSVQDGTGDRVLAPGTAAAHNQSAGGVLRLDFSPPAGHVELTVQTDRIGAGFELRALDADGRELSVTRVYDEPADCELHPVLQSFPVHLDHHGIAAVEARGVVETAADQPVLWTIRRLSYRFDSAHPASAGPIATPTATPTPDPQAPTPTPTPTRPPSLPVLSDLQTGGSTLVRVSGLQPPGSRVEIRTTDTEGRVVVLGAGTADEDGSATVRLLRPLKAGEPVYALNLRTLEQSSPALVVASTISAAGLVLLGLALVARVRRG